ncbi:WD40 repeat-containing protein [Handroanthus impetiginosus]|uniref:WD40 repeat-containing protein n=1 Tax=Handroanthus impetiginosus TaxID=429701 RepID=A0A2G9G6L3_9LAMI|nr:WD40 repeat-containing protein [Handroanthus impetiginosus]
MMDSYSETEEDQFFDSRDDISSVSDLGSDCSEGCLISGLGYDYWTKNPESVNERREKFLKIMGLDSDWRRIGDDEEEDLRHEEMERDMDRLRDDGETVLANLDSEQKFFSSRSLPSFGSRDAADLVEDSSAEEWKIKNLDDGTEFVVDEVAEDGTLAALREVGSDRMISFDEFQKTLGSSDLVQQLLRKDLKGFNMVDSKKKMKSNWLQRFSAVTHIADKTKGLLDKPNEINSKTTRRVHVHVSRKHSKELSSLHTGQEFHAHEGSILTMKFSPDGRYLASAGVDGVVRVWKVFEDDIVNKLNAQDIDPSCLYFSLNHSSKLTPLDVAKEKIGSAKSLRRSTESSCVVLPPKVFQLSEKPLHEFHGHNGEVLALSWSKNGHLLSSSVDKTARLWKVGHDDCLRVYSHNNYVTCVDFNPVDDNHFISGSIDGKLRIWEVEGGRVIDWTDIREIVTAVCYCPDGKGGVVGSMDGNCRFYDVIDNRLQLGAEICLKGKKKKLPGKRITGFQYCPSDASKVMVTSADSQVRIICGTDIVCKFKGNRSSGSQVPASFTSDGEHIVSISEDSNVRVWNYMAHDQKSSRPKKVWSCESFLSKNASMAIPWGGLKNKLGSLPGNILSNGHFDEKLLQKFPDCFTTSLGFFLDTLYKGSATWPEEKLPQSNPTTVKPSLCKSEFKFLKNAWLSALNSPHLWGLVIVTAGFDGCIRTFLNYGLPIRF